jgi:hypothetical protein
MVGWTCRLWVVGVCVRAGVVDVAGAMTTETAGQYALVRQAVIALAELGQMPDETAAMESVQAYEATAAGF